MESASYHGGWQGYGPSSPSGLITSHSVEHFNVFNLAVLGSSLLCAGTILCFGALASHCGGFSCWGHMGLVTARLWDRTCVPCNGRADS